MTLAISIDLDEIGHYRGLHGMPDARGDVDPVFSRAVPRFANWARQRGIPLTWFVVGRDLGVPANAEIVARLAREGDELGCHSFSHHYDLTRRPFTEMRAEVMGGVEAIQAVAQVEVFGFRAPGYVVTDTLLDLLRECGFRYDSSVFPSPAYYALKAAAVAALTTRRLSSKAIIDVPDVLQAPTTPYRVGRPYWFRGTGIWEVPIQVTGRARLPFIGTTLALAGRFGARVLARGLVGQPFVNLELHGIDVLDQSDGLDELAERQRDLRIPWARKLAAIDAAVSILRSSGHRCVRLNELAQAAST